MIPQGEAAESVKTIFRGGWFTYLQSTFFSGPTLQVVSMLLDSRYSFVLFPALENALYTISILMKIIYFHEENEKSDMYKANVEIARPTIKHRVSVTCIVSCHGLSDVMAQR